MRQLFAEVPEACDNTLWIAERANVEIEFGKPQLPELPAARGLRRRRRLPPAPHLRGRQAALGRRSCPTRSSSASPTSSRSSTTWASARTSSSSGTSSSTPATPTSGSVPGRGSAAGCAVAYCLRITDLDPIKYDLLFERFLNPRRISMPDIDMDFDSRYRDEMIRYAAERYGRDHVAQIVTFSTIKARAAVRDAARVLGYPYAVGDKVAKAMPPLVMGRDTPLYACLEPHAEVRRRLQDGRRPAGDVRRPTPTSSKVIDVAKGLEGLRRQDGIHAAAVVITKEPLTEYLPIQRKPEAGQRPRGRPGRHPVRDARRRGPRPAQDGLPGPAQPRRHHRHPRADQGLPGHRPRHRQRPARRRRRPTSCCAGATPSACSSSRAAPCARSCARWRPTSFEDVAALVALYRPGPDGGQHAQRLRRPQERPQAGRRTSTPTPRSCSATPTA